MTSVENVDIKQARHNKKAALALYEKDEFHDWVITTCYYSALRYIQGSVFPLKYDGAEYPDFKTFWSKKIEPEPLLFFRKGKPT